jgi:hypothetical protein
MDAAPSCPGEDVSAAEQRTCRQRVGWKSLPEASPTPEASSRERTVGTRRLFLQ